MSRIPRRRISAIFGTAAAAAMLLAACGSTVHSSSASRAKGGIAYFAEQAGDSPNYIFPLMDSSDFTGANFLQFAPLMYRPLYFFGIGSKAELNKSLSLADLPVYSNNDKTVTITLKKYMWSDGEQLTSRNVIFWMNLLKANTGDWAAYVPGDFPDNVVSDSAPNASTVVFQLNKSYSPTWFTYNELSQITPLPMAWDRTSLSNTAPGPTTANLPDTTASGARAVYKFLNAQAEDLSTYATSPLWSVVDGPWKLKSFTTEGKAVFVPNKSYSGPIKPTLSEFVELPFTSDASEFNVVRAGNNAITYGYLPFNDLPQKAAVESIGYKVEPWITLGFGYWVENYNNPTYGPVFQQLYFRQALQHLVDQPAWIKSFFDDYAVPSYSPVPLAPANPFVDQESKTNPYPYSISTAKNLLVSHGWKMVNGVMTCESPGTSGTECGKDIPKGLALNINLQYASGDPTLTEEMEAFASAAKQAGITINLSSTTVDAVLTNAAPCTTTQASCKWEMANWGNNTWGYMPDYYPSGGEIFSTGAGSNFGNYDSTTANALIAATHTSSDPQAALDTYQNFMVKQLPVVYQPSQDGQISVISSKLHGVSQTSSAVITPEEWYFTK